MTASVEALLRPHVSKLLVIDTNLLLLLTVGIADRRRIREFTSVGGSDQRAERTSRAGH